jgi:hypothetical protein
VTTEKGTDYAGSQSVTDTWADPCVSNMPFHERV